MNTTAPTFDRMSVHLSPDYLRTFQWIKPHEYGKTGLIQVFDKSMAPNLLPGQTMVVVLMERTAYLKANGVVVITLHSRPGTYFVGRVATSRNRLHLSPDNAHWPGLTVDLADVSSLCEVRYCINKFAS